MARIANNYPRTPGAMPARSELRTSEQNDVRLAQNEKKLAQKDRS